ncbi:MAG: hypothetical protein Fur0037_15100 [Planctomycetota bacterium]
MEPAGKDAFLGLLDGLVERLEGFDWTRPSAEQAEGLLPFAGPAVGRIRAAALAARDGDWLLPKENGGIRFGRVAKDLRGYSVDAVWMSGPGPKHRHPHGEIDLCFADGGDPRFDGNAEGWVVYGPGSVHVPTVRGGAMLILYFLPRGAIEFLDR